MFLAQLVAELAAAIHTLQKNTRTTKNKERKKEFLWIILKYLHNF